MQCRDTCATYEGKRTCACKGANPWVTLHGDGIERNSTRAEVNRQKNIRALLNGKSPVFSHCADRCCRSRRIAEKQSCEQREGGECPFYGQGKDGKVGGGRGYFREVGEIGALGSGLLRSKQEMEFLENE